ncbi:MAG: hypothetical protein HC836_23420 [Richelia sp. RM2_1_2]|nr:hypothetical protein [Richelia sp. RM2_1_2]
MISKDRANKKNLSIENLDEWIKPFGMVSVAVIYGNAGTADDMASAKNVVSALRSEGYSPEESVIISVPTGSNDDDSDPKGINKKKKKSNFATNFSQLFSVNHIVETIAEIAKLDKKNNRKSNAPVGPLLKSR